VPANLPAEAKAAWLKVMEAKTPEEKIRAMEEFLSSVPKHKGTEKLIKHIRRRMAELKREMQERREKERSLRGGGARLYIAKEGDLQVAVVGPEFWEDLVVVLLDKHHAEARRHTLLHGGAYAVYVCGRRRIYPACENAQPSPGPVQRP